MSQVTQKELSEEKVPELMEYVKDTVQFIFSIAGFELPISIREEEEKQDEIKIHRDISELNVRVITLNYDMIDFIFDCRTLIETYADNVNLIYDTNNAEREVRVFGEFFDEVSRTRKSYFIVTKQYGAELKLEITTTEEKYE